MNLLGSYDQDKVGFQFKDIDNKLKENKTINSSDSVLEKFIKNIKFLVRIFVHVDLERMLQKHY